MTAVFVQDRRIMTVVCLCKEYMTNCQRLCICSLTVVQLHYIYRVVQKKMHKFHYITLY